MTSIIYPFGYPVVSHEESFDLSILYLHNSTDATDGIIVHNRYEPLEFNASKLELPYFRLGRSIDIVDLQNGELINYKGVGADATLPMQIHPWKWFEEKGGKYIQSHEKQLSAKVWGALTESESQDEFANDCYASAGLKCSALLKFNVFPKELTEKIISIEGGEFTYPASQLKRKLDKTNIRFNMPEAKLVSRAIDQAALAEIDAQFISAQIGYASVGKTFFIIGGLDKNRYIDGSFTDNGNCAILKYNHKTTQFMIKKLVTTSADIFSSTQRNYYLSYLSELTGHDFFRTAFPKSLDEQLRDYAHQNKNL
ncbi:MAG: hypothetical protein NDI94_02540 [Candidatus Woesearchaeota archaeon]|nr:hypothetical protein [Candidatus Woesearchaeota archaeon]